MRNTDNSNRVIVNPETCDRGPYMQFRITDSTQGRTITVHGRTVEVLSTGTVSSAADDQARLERALVETARSRLDSGTYEFLLSQLNY